MTATAGEPQRPKLQAPKADRGELVVPPLAELGTMLPARAHAGPEIAGMAWPKLAAQAREEFLAAAWRYTASYRDAPRPAADTAVVLAGHQPQMFHPGVWCKNFLLSRIAQERQATAVNLVVDNDTLKGPSLRVPGGSIANPISAAVDFDATAEAAPFEERRVADPAIFRSFGERAAEELSPFIAEPLLGEYWPLVVERSKTTDLLGECLAQSRHQLEGAWGQETLELPQSIVCELPSFRLFVSHLLGEADRFRQIHNAALLAHRRAHRIRSAHHPVPELVQNGEWIETPFWTWTAVNPRRRKLFVRQSGQEWRLTDREKWEAGLPRDPHHGGGPSPAALADLSAQGIKLRTRALTTTIWARLFLGDLFVHGIGGAKYDQLTDELIRAFFRVEPPAYMVATATLRLPIERERVTGDDLRKTDDSLRTMEFHPEIFLGVLSSSDDSRQQTAELQALVAAKRAAIALPDSREAAKTRCGAIHAANDAFQPWLTNLRAQTIAKRQLLVDRLRADGVLASREFGFPLFPSSMLRNFLLEFPSQKAYT